VRAANNSHTRERSARSSHSHKPSFSSLGEEAKQKKRNTLHLHPDPLAPPQGQCMRAPPTGRAVAYRPSLASVEAAPACARKCSRMRAACQRGLWGGGPNLLPPSPPPRLVLICVLPPNPTPFSSRRHPHRPRQQRFQPRLSVSRQQIAKESVRGLKAARRPAPPPAARPRSPKNKNKKPSPLPR
jgi:hypothetical protein